MSETKNYPEPASPSNSKPPAEVWKEKGNKSFASGDFDSAVASYTEAIELDRTNHVFFSNRSASYGGLSEWSKSAADARECIKLCPLFIKGYYRLVTALIELNDIDDALRVVRRGLQIDGSNAQLEKLMRQVKVRKAAEKKRLSSTEVTSSASSGSSTKPRTADEAQAKEIMDLQEQFISTNREYNVVNANISKAQREQNMADLTMGELSKIEDGTKMYRGIGKMFMLSSHKDCINHLQTSIELERTLEKDLTQKKDYLEKRIKSQQINIQELTGTFRRKQ
eukprot:CAMPEP_0194297978 /NCGR_PEP_ID=MMETSP0169-20130528/59910_1 /TAXON_ID=218684 /ORGANISM="Corethron pennatum, Strain L29A3" /LENGTH=280 /DNA_ID=CAMNT_0039047909 /DNA_START=769 /DNA_END=1611 /DNA_ORIENTATION=-